MEHYCLIISIEVGGLTQYKTRVQGMSPEIEEHFQQKISKFMWEDKYPTININTLHSKIQRGGKQLLDIAARNKAIELMKLWDFMKEEDDYSCWATVADSLIACNIPKSQDISEESKKTIFFLQSWMTKLY